MPCIQVTELLFKPSTLSDDWEDAPIVDGKRKLWINVSKIHTFFDETEDDFGINCCAISMGDYFIYVEESAKEVDVKIDRAEEKTYYY